jgi:stearoyl-CoA desaturase (delta-9 desaturase)
MSPFWEKFFYVFTFITQGSSYLSPHAYGILHRLHHEHADTEDDVHSPKYDGSLMAMMWRTANIYEDIYDERTFIDPKYRKGLPNWRPFEKIAGNWMLRVLWIAAYTAFYVAFVPEGQWWMYALLPIHFVMGPIHGAIINWFAHKYGYVNFEVNDTSKNFLPFDFLMMGESYHNNHHTYQARPNFGGFRWHEFDPTYPFIWLFHKVGIIRLRRVPQTAAAY